MLTTIIVLAVAGILAILLEMVLPGGILGIGGVLCLVAVVVLSFVEYGAAWGLFALVVLVIFGCTMTWAWMKFFHRLPFTKNLVLSAEVGDDEELQARQDAIIGQTGEALTDLRPSGKARINGAKIDVMTESGVIEKGTAIVVIDTRGPSIFVRQAE